MPHPNVKPIGVVYQREKPHHVVKIVQRLPNPHQHDVGDFRPAVLLGKDDLVKNLSGCQVPHLAAQGGGAEHAAHIAPYLAGHTNSIPMLIPHQNRLDTISVQKPPQVFYGTVRLRHLLPLHLGHREEALLLQHLPQRLGQIAHLVEGFHAPVEPAEHLRGPEPGQAQLLKPGFQL